MKSSLALLAPLLAAAPAAAQLTVDNTGIPSGSPANQSSTENVDFADVDLDGDWDIGMADGGDWGADQNRIWINQGGLQGGVIGTFLDETTARFPAVNDQSRDFDFADYDGDGDQDIFIANSSQVFSNSSRFWTNLGFEQGGALGFYVDETDTRFVGLGGPGSSIPPSFLLPGGGFVDWAHDGEFADLDNDGDLDLLQASTGGSATGLVPSRIFLNDGDGHFTELNPSGFQLTGANLQPGDPGLWCDGVQQANTTDTTGAFCDITTSVEDADFGDIDGDFDLDLLLGDRVAPPRMFVNRLDGSSLAPSAGELRFRDVTNAVFLPGYATGGNAFEQEMGDLDGDGDLDILGVNWAVGFFNFTDKVLRNNGSGVFDVELVLPDSGADDNEGDFLDFDSDGDLDIYIANFSGLDRLYRNDGPGGFVLEGQVGVNQISLDADAADLDGDGDQDVLVAHEVVAPNVYLRNDYNVPDLHAPVIPSVEAVAPAAATGGVLPVRAHVYDNAPYYVTYFAGAVLQVTVDGVQLPPLPVTSSGGQVFRGELPANLVGDVTYAFQVTDERGNVGTSAATAFTSTGDTGLLYGTASSGGTVGIQSLAELHAGSAAYLRATAPAGAPTFVGVSLTKQDPPLAVPGLPNLVLNIGAPLLVLVSGVADAAGDLVVPAEIAPGSGGVSLFAQALALDGATFESSQGIELLILP